jgi:hypothetical protein
MIPQQFFYHLVVLGLLWLFVMLHDAWPSRCVASPHQPAKPILPPRQHSSDPPPFPGLTRPPLCAACEQAHADAPQPPGCPPPRRVPTRGRPRQVEPSQQCCPSPACAYQGWGGRGPLCANGHPSGGPWRQRHCTSCGGSVQEPQGTPLHGKRVAPETLVWAVGALAAGLGLRAVARVFAVAPTTVLAWLVEGAEHAAAVSQYVLHDVRGTQGHLDELLALLSAVQPGEGRDAEAIQRLSRSPHWGWAAMDPVTKLRLPLDVGDRTLAMAPRVVHQVVQVRAPGCVPLFLTDGCKEYPTALLPPGGQCVQPPRRQDTGPPPKPRWRPLPHLLYAQGMKTGRRRRLVRVRHRVVCGTLETVNAVLAPRGGQITTAFIERLTLTIRQHVAAVGRRVATLCKGENGVRQQLVLYHGYSNFCLPHASVCQPLLQPVPTNGTGSAKRWQPRTPAMAAGLTDHVWTLREVLRCRVPPWPQPAEG